MFQMMNHTSQMNAAVNAEAVFSCANSVNNTAMLLDATTMASIIFAILGLRLCALTRSLLGLLAIRLQNPVPIFA